MSRNFALLLCVLAVGCGGGGGSGSTTGGSAARTVNTPGAIQDASEPITSNGAGDSSKLPCTFLGTCSETSDSTTGGTAPGGTASAPSDGSSDTPINDGGATTTDLPDDGFPANGVVGLRAVSLAQTVQQPVPLTFGQVFAQGDVPQGSSVVATVDGQSLPTQVDQKATWPDGSLRHAVITVRLASLAAGASPGIALELTGPAASQFPITLAGLLGTNFDAEVTVELGGTTYRASARELLAQVQASGCPDWSRQCKHWLSGPLVSEWIVGGPLTSGNASTDHLSVQFHVRAYADASGAITRVRVDNVIENTHAYGPGHTHDQSLNPQRLAFRSQNVTYNVHLQTGTNNFSMDNLTHYREARWHKVLWWGDAPQVYAKLDTEYLQSTRAISNYAEITPTEELLNNIASSYPPMDNGAQTAHMGAGGAQAAIGPLPRWTSVYVVSDGDQRAFDWMLANDTAVGSYGFHFRDEVTGRPVTITDHPYITIAALSYARNRVAAGDQRYTSDTIAECLPGFCGGPFAFDIAHHPSIGYVPYLVTGDYYYLEEMQFTASYIELWANPTYRELDKGRVRGAQGQVRGQAWALRSIADAAFATPDNDPMKGYFQDIVNYTLDDYHAAFVENGGQSPLHIVADHGAVIYTMQGETRVGFAPWQQHFFVWSVGHAAQLGFGRADAFYRWLSHFPINQMTNWLDDPDGGYCWLQASAYNLRVRDTQGSPFYPDLNTAYRNTFPELVGLDCNSQAYVNALNGREIGEMSGYPFSATGFPSNLQIGLAMAADSGLPNAGMAWQIFANRSVQPYPDHGGNLYYRDYPNFAVVPRD